MNRKRRRADTKISRYEQFSAPQATSKMFMAAMRHLRAGRINEQIECLRKATKIAPEFAAAHYNLGNALGEQGQLDEAVTCFNKAIEIAPGFAEAYSNLGVALKQQGKLDEAMRGCLKAVELDPRFSVAYFNLGTVFEEQRRLRQAIPWYRKAIELRPDFAVAHLNLAMTLLTVGDFPEGWKEHEWRWKTPQMIDGSRNFSCPQWCGDAAAGRTLLIHAEQGFGDTLQFCRYASLAAARGFRVIIEVPKQLVRLLQSLNGVGQVISIGEQLPPFDVHSPMMSLPFAMGTTVATIPDLCPYLQADNAAIEIWRARLAAMAIHGPRVGLVWAGNPSKDSPALTAIDNRRSMALERLAPLFRLLGFKFFSLQKDHSASGLFPIIDLMANVTDFADTAAFIANLDLIISVDTAVAHLVGALGKPIWLLNRFDSDWRWMDGRSDSPWYPTLRIYRQPQPNDWDAVVSEVISDLQRVAATGSRSWLECRKV